MAVIAKFAGVTEKRCFLNTNTNELSVDAYMYGTPLVATDYSLCIKHLVEVMGPWLDWEKTRNTKS